MSSNPATDIAIDVRHIFKGFTVPSVRRDTVREHALDFFRPRPRERLAVLNDVSFAVRRGEAVGLMGRNGSGKSTLLRIVSGIYQPDAGAVTISGGLTPVLELGVGFNPELTAIDNVYLHGTVMGLTLKQVRRSLPEILRFAELERFAEMKVQFFSSGMAARLAYAVAFKAAQEIVILDEIFAVGDAGFQRRCRQVYRGLIERGHTVVLVSHDPETIAELCSRAILLEAGKVLLDADSKTVAEAYLRFVAQPSSPPPGATARDAGSAAG